MSKLNKGGDEPSLSSSTYLNIRAIREALPDEGESEKTGLEKLFRQVAATELWIEMVGVAEQMSHAPMDDYAYLKGQYVILHRILNPDDHEATAQIEASKAARVWGKQRKKILHGVDDQSPMSDELYLEFCGVGELVKGCQVKYRGEVEYGNFVWCWVCEQWEVAAGDEVGQTVRDRFTLELIDEEKPV